MAKTTPRRRAAALSSVETGTAETSTTPQLTVDVDGWQAVLEWSGRGKPAASVERVDGFVLVHFDMPAPESGPLGEYHINVRAPFVDIHRSWVGSIDCWRGSELVSIALNYEFDSVANRNMPVICNYNRFGENRGVIALLNQTPATHINQRPIIDTPPMHLMQTRFSRKAVRGGFRETLVLGRQKTHFSHAIQRLFQLCKRRLSIQPMAAPDWARAPVWCSWYSHLYHLTQEQVHAQIPHLVRAGFGTVVLDASWFKRPDAAMHRVAGVYRADAPALPDLRALSRRLHDQGLRLMLWCAPHFLGFRSSLRAAMSPYCIHDSKSRSYLLCPSCPQSIAHVRTLTERLMRDYELDGLKLDFLDTVEPRCIDKKHPHVDGDPGLSMLKLMAAARDGMLSVKADAAIEYRVSYSTLSSLGMANCHRGNDGPYDADYIRRENLFLRLFCDYPSAVWSDYAYWHPRESPANIALMLGQQIFSGGVPTVSIDLTQCSDAHRRSLTQWLSFYNEHRDALARANLIVHSADSVMSTTSLNDEQSSTSFVLLAGQELPRDLSLPAGTRDAFVFSAASRRSGAVSLRRGRASKHLNLKDVTLSHVRWAR